MKNVFLIAILIIAGTFAKAQNLDIKNSTDCDMMVSVRAFDFFHTTCTLQSFLFKVSAWTSSPTFTSVDDINIPPSMIGWQGGVPSNAGAGPWGWDAIKFYSSTGGTYGGQIGNISPGCSATTTLTFPNACSSGTGTYTVYADWVVSGGNTSVTFHY
jgi:hypothetical protein